MNNYPDLTLAYLSQVLRINVIENWLVQPEPLRYTEEEYFGNLEEEIASYDASAVPAAPIPEIDPDEFESDYLWFLS